MELLYRVAQEYEKGKNQLNVSRADIPVSGMIFYKMESGGYSSIRSMILID